MRRRVEKIAAFLLSGLTATAAVMGLALALSLTPTQAGLVAPAAEAVETA